MNRSGPAPTWTDAALGPPGPAQNLRRPWMADAQGHGWPTDSGGPRALPEDGPNCARGEQVQH
jgi:hypothetical protein